MKGKTALLVLTFAVVALAGCVGGSGDSTDDGDLPNQGNTTDGDSNLGGEIDPDALRAHVHDRWEGETVKTVVDQSVELRFVDPEEPGLTESCQSNDPEDGTFLIIDSCYGSKWFFPDDGQIVPPGTAYLEVTVNYDTNRVPAVELFFQDAGPNSRLESLDWFEPGETKRILGANGGNITVEESDNGHAIVSAWKFLAEARQNPYAPALFNAPDVNGANVDIDIQAFRVDGELPLEPPHPVFWDDDEPPTDLYRTAMLQASTEGFVQAGQVAVEPGADPQEPEQVINTAGRGLTWRTTPGYLWEYPAAGDEDRTELSAELDRALVPPQVKSLRADVRVEGDTATGVHVCVWGKHSPSGGIGDKLGCQPYGGDGEQVLTFETPVDGTQEDTFYTDNAGGNASRWTFTLQVISQEGEAGAAEFSGTLQMVIVTSDQDSINEIPEWAWEV